MPKSIVECKTVIKQNKRRLVYHNSRTNKSLPIVVGKRGGISVKSPNSKTRRYIKKQCARNGTSSFKTALANMQKKK